MTVSKNSIKACSQCGCVFTEDCVNDPYKCPICKSTASDDIED